MKKRKRSSRLQEDVRAADQLHEPTIKRLHQTEEQNVHLKAQLIATTMELVRTRHVLNALRGRPVVRIIKRD